MSAIVWKVLLGSFVIVLSLIGFFQSRWKALRLAIILAWFGPFPGFFLASHLYEWRLPALLSLPRDTLLYALLPYVAFAVPIFGSYCFAVGLLGGWFIIRFTQDPAPKWAQPLAIVVISALASVPIVLIEGGVSEEFSRYALISSAFWCIVLLLFRRRIFVTYTV